MVTSGFFKREVASWAKEIGVTIKEIHLRKMSRKWASCSSKGRLTFEKELLGKSKEMRTKVIVHELLHLKYPNHGRMFKVMEKLYLNKVKQNER